MVDALLPFDQIAVHDPGMPIVPAFQVIARFHRIQRPLGRNTAQHENARYILKALPFLCGSARESRPPNHIGIACRIDKDIAVNFDQAVLVGDPNGCDAAAGIFFDAMEESVQLQRYPRLLRHLEDDNLVSFRVVGSQMKLLPAARPVPVSAADMPGAGVDGFHFLDQFFGNPADHAAAMTIFKGKKGNAKTRDTAQIAVLLDDADRTTLPGCRNRGDHASRAAADHNNFFLMMTHIE